MKEEKTWMGVAAFIFVAVFGFYIAAYYKESQKFLEVADGQIYARIPFCMMKFETPGESFVHHVCANARYYTYLPLHKLDRSWVRPLYWRGQNPP